MPGLVPVLAPKSWQNQLGMLPRHLVVVEVVEPLQSWLETAVERVLVPRGNWLESSVAADFACFHQRHPILPDFVVPVEPGRDRFRWFTGMRPRGGFRLWGMV